MFRPSHIQFKKNVLSKAPSESEGVLRRHKRTLRSLLLVATQGVLDKNHHPLYFLDCAKTTAQKNTKHKLIFGQQRKATHQNARLSNRFIVVVRQRARTHLRQRVGRFKRSASVRVHCATHRRKYNEIREYINYLDNALTC